MPQQHSTHKLTNRVRPTPLLMLWTWIGLVSGLSQLSLSTLEAQASDLIIPAEPPAAPAARPAPKPAVRPAPKPVVRSAPAPKPVVRSAPAPKPVVRSAPAPKPVVRSAPAPKPAKPAPVISAPVRQPLTPPSSSGVSASPQAPKSPAIKKTAPASKPVSKPPTVPSAPRAQGGNPLIDTSRNYDLGATQAQPYVKPNQVVVSERSSGCQAVVGRSVSSSICGGGTPPARRVRVQPPRTIAVQQKAAPVNLRQPYVASRVQRQAPAVNVPRGLTPANAPTFAAKPYQQGQLYKAKAFKGANPLKWLLSDGKQMIFPLSIPARISSAFGWRMHPISGQRKFHTGTDIAAPMGTPVVAAYDGDVAIADYLGGYGLSVLLHHNKGEHATRYAHLSEIFVQPGQAVEQGTVIGLVGSTGNSTGPHLHFEAMQRTPQGYAHVNPDVQVEIALSVLVEAIQVAQQPEPTESVEQKPSVADELLRPQLQARVATWTSPLDYTLTE